MSAQKQTVLIYSDENGKEPFTEWLRSLDPPVRARILKRIERFEDGAFGDHTQLKGASDIYEARFFFGGGYRVYFGKEGSTIVILLSGGDKKSQKKDTVMAEQYWKSYCERED